MTRILHGTDTDLPELLHGALAELTDGQHHVRLNVAAGVDSLYSADAVVFRVADRAALVIGTHSLLNRVRALFGDNGCAGWNYHHLEPPLTPLSALDGPLHARWYNLLARIGFTAVEQINALPDESLQSLENGGPKFVRQTREAIELIGLTGPAAQRRDRMTPWMAPATQTRYRDLIDRIARSNLPDEQLLAIAQALAAEPVPEADARVLSLLAATDLTALNMYRQTHSEPAAGEAHQQGCVAEADVQR